MQNSGPGVDVSLNPVAVDERGLCFCSSKNQCRASTIHITKPDSTITCRMISTFPLLRSCHLRAVLPAPSVPKEPFHPVD